MRATDSLRFNPSPTQSLHRLAHEDSTKPTCFAVEVWCTLLCWLLFPMLLLLQLLVAKETVSMTAKFTV